MMHEFTLRDADGAEHHYRMTCMDPEQGVDMTLRLWSMACGPLGEALGSAIKGARGILEGKGSVREMLDDPDALTALWGVLDNLDGGAIGRDLERSLMKLDRDTIKRLFQLVSRDEQPLRNAAAFNDAYRGNWWEMGRALVKIIQVNRFFPRFDTGTLAKAISSQAPSDASSAKQGSTV